MVAGGAHARPWRDATTRRTFAEDDLQVRLVVLFRDLGLRPGDALPSEPALATRLAVGRPSVREALRGLQALGVVDGRQGARRRLVGFDPAVFGRRLALVAMPSRSDLQELLEVRRVLESGLLPAAIFTLDADCLRRLRALTDRMGAKAARGECFLEEDERFHALLYERLGNRVFSGLSSAFWHMFNGASATITTGHDLPHSAAMHASIVDALEAGDGSLAVHRLDAHFFDVRDRLMSALERDHK